METFIAFMSQQQPLPRFYDSIDHIYDILITNHTFGTM